MTDRDYADRADEGWARQQARRDAAADAREGFDLDDDVQDDMQDDVENDDDGEDLDPEQEEPAAPHGLPDWPGHSLRPSRIGRGV